MDSDTYARWREARLAASTLHEPAPDELPGETLLQQIWLHQRLRRQGLRTVDGQPVAVLHPGFWNREAGPDFRKAVLQFGGDAPCTGDVEVDVRAEGWRQHHHAGNPAYRRVRLHVVWEADARTQAVLPTLELKGAIDASLGELRAWLGVAAVALPAELYLGRCAAPLRQLAPAGLVELLRQAARFRLEHKAELLRARAREVGWEQALWEGLFAALGYQHNVWPMRRLGELRARLALELPPERSPALVYQARLFGLAGLLPTDLEAVPPATRNHVRDLWDIWWRDRDALAAACLPAGLWRLHGLRPANHPQRRLALAAHWLAESGLLDRIEAWIAEDIPAAAWLESLLERLRTKPDEFWSWHWTLRSRWLAVPQPLLGPPRVTDLAINVILPWLWSRASAGRSEAVCARVETRYFGWRASEDNAVLRLARQRLLAGGRLPLPCRAASQQGLLQVVRDFCDRSDALCSGCPFPGHVEGLAAAAAGTP